MSHRQPLIFLFLLYPLIVLLAGCSCDGSDDDSGNSGTGDDTANDDTTDDDSTDDDSTADDDMTDDDTIDDDSSTDDDSIDDDSSDNSYCIPLVIDYSGDCEKPITGWAAGNYSDDDISDFLFKLDGGQWVFMEDNNRPPSVYCSVISERFSIGSDETSTQFYLYNCGTWSQICWLDYNHNDRAPIFNFIIDETGHLEGWIIGYKNMFHLTDENWEKYQGQGSTKSYKLKVFRSDYAIEDRDQIFRKWNGAAWSDIIAIADIPLPPPPYDQMFLVVDQFDIIGVDQVYFSGTITEEIGSMFQWPVVIYWDGTSWTYVLGPHNGPWYMYSVPSIHVNDFSDIYILIDEIDHFSLGHYDGVQWESNMAFHNESFYPCGPMHFVAPNEAWLACKKQSGTPPYFDYLFVHMLNDAITLVPPPIELNALWIEGLAGEI